MNSKRQQRWIKLLTNEWAHKLTALFTWIILLQFIIWFSEYWFYETIDLTITALSISLVIELMPSLRRWIRRVLALILIVASHYVILDNFMNIRLDNIKDGMLVQLLQYNVQELHPYIWFSLAVWLIYIVCLSVTRTVYGIFGLLIVSILSFSIMDSFSVLILWDQIGLILFAGLSLLIVRHFARLQRKHPDGWQDIIERPQSILVPILLTLSFIFIAGKLAPEVPPMITDPYTAWKHSIGEEVTVSGKTLTSDSIFPTANAKSGYSRDDTQLGGSFDFDYSPVMTVNTSRKSYWRGESKAIYTGLGWEYSNRDLQFTVWDNTEDGIRFGPHPGVNTGQLKTEDVTQTFTLIKQKAPLLFAAPSPFLLILDPERKEVVNYRSLVWYPRMGQLSWRDKKPPKTYTIVSKVPIIDEEGLRKVPIATALSVDLKEYLQLPGTLPERVRTLAKDVTHTATNSFDQAKLLEQYLKDNYQYTTKPDRSAAQSDDFVDRFLFEIKQGYCDYFSTSMVVMARTLGLPARWVKGYAAGQLPADRFNGGGMPREVQEDLEDLDGPGLYTVRNADAHSWVEIYFDGYGWISFEPTAGFTMPIVIPEGEVQDLDLSPDLGDIAVNGDVSTPWWQSGVMLWIGSSLMVIGLLVTLYLFRIKLFTRWIGRSSSPQIQHSNKRMILEFERILKFVKRKGFIHEDHETIRETMNRWCSEYYWLETDLRIIMAVFEKAKYSRSLVSEDELTGAINSIANIKTYARKM